MLLYLLDRARIAGMYEAFLEVRPSNAVASRLYRSLGFEQVGIRKGYYQLTGEDAYVMWAYDLPSPEYTQRIAAIEAELRSRPVLRR